MFARANLCPFVADFKFPKKKNTKTLCVYVFAGKKCHPFRMVSVHVDTVEGDFQRKS